MRRAAVEVKVAGAASPPRPGLSRAGVADY